jgi:hypothetical protein
MSEVNAPPTDDEIKAVRFDIDGDPFLDQGKTLQEYAASALAEFKNDIEDVRGFKFTQVFDETADEYFSDTDDYTRNLNKIRKDILCNLTIALVFRDFMIAASDDVESRWFNLYTFYRSEYDNALKISQLDVDIDESGTITEDEERTSGQKFFSK